MGDLRLLCPAKAGCLRRIKRPTVSSPLPLPAGAGRVIICDYNALLLSVTGLLRMSGYCVFQAYNGQAAAELCRELPDLDLLVLNTEGTGTDTPTLVRTVRRAYPGLPVLHIGASAIPGMPPDVPTLAESFTADQLLAVVGDLVRVGAPHLSSPSLPLPDLPRVQGSTLKEPPPDLAEGGPTVIVPPSPETRRTAGAPPAELIAKDVSLRARQGELITRVSKVREANAIFLRNSEKAHHPVN
jgi:CheY-like chemotaxis protein